MIKLTHGYVLKTTISEVFVTRKLVKDGSQYFGPFTSFKTINTIMGIIKKLYPLRNCSYNLSEKNILKKIQSMP